MRVLVPESSFARAHLLARSEVRDWVIREVHAGGDEAWLRQRLKLHGGWTTERVSARSALPLSAMASPLATMTSEQNAANATCLNISGKISA